MTTRQERNRDAPNDLAASAAESAGGADAAVGMNPLLGVGSGVAEVMAGFREIGVEAITHPWSGVEPSSEFVEQVSRAWVGRSEAEPKRGDKRFADPTWRDNPFYRAWMQSYLAWTDALERFVDKSGLDAKNAQRARFALSLLTDAFAPTNVWLGNPAALKKFVETGGVSAIHGFENMLDDIAHNRGMPAQVDKSAFEVGKNLALTPGAVVFQNPVLELIQYTPTTDKVYERPLLLVPPQINKFYVLDLAPGRSLVEYLVQQGIQTFVLSWRNPTPADREWGLEMYLRSMLEATAALREITGSPDLNILGTCSGGITTALLLGHLARSRRPGKPRVRKGCWRDRSWRRCSRGCAPTTWSGTIGSTTTCWARARPYSTSCTGTTTPPTCRPGCTATFSTCISTIRSPGTAPWSCSGRGSTCRG